MAPGTHLWPELHWAALLPKPWPGLVTEHLVIGEGWKLSRPPLLPPAPRPALLSVCPFASPTPTLTTLFSLSPCRLRS